MVHLQKKSDDIFELIENDITSLSNNGNQFIFCGDFNARTNTEPDFCTTNNADTLNKHLDLPFLLSDDVPIPRCNLDTQNCNSRGQKLLQMCKCADLRILNGRFFGDTMGRFTCYSQTGMPSTIDYILSSNSLIENVRYVTVNDLTVHSIHCSISSCFSLGAMRGNHETNSKTQYERVKKFVWSQVDTNRFLESLAKDHIQQELRDLIKQFDVKDTEDVSHTDNIDLASIKLIDIISGAAKSAGLKMKCKPKTRQCGSSKKKTRSKPWFDEKCKSLKAQCSKLFAMIKRDPFNRKHRFEFNRVKKLYKGTLNENKSNFEKQIWASLDNFHKSNPKEYWKLLSDLRGIEEKQKKNLISMEQWVKHFSSLLNKAMTPNKSLMTEIDTYIDMNRDRLFNELNFSISLVETSNAIRNLKTNKAAGLDGIVNEMFKTGISSLLSPLHKIFNSILTHGHFPSSWHTNTLSPLFKKGDQFDPKNYRGIAVSSSLSKIFLSIMQKRLSNFSKSHNLIPSCQIAYKQNSSTSDHILTLKKFD